MCASSHRGVCVRVCTYESDRIRPPDILVVLFIVHASPYRCSANRGFEKGGMVDCYGAERVGNGRRGNGCLRGRVLGSLFGEGVV